MIMQSNHRSQKKINLNNGEKSMEEKFITSQDIVHWIEDCASVFNRERAYLTELDSAIGDADHGTNMVRGFMKAKEKLPSVADTDIGNILKTIGMTLISSVGGASGPLFGTFFMRAGSVVPSKHELDTEDLAKMLEAGLDGLVQRGRAKPGEKTMVDAVYTALLAAQAALSREDEIQAALLAVAEAAAEGVERTIPMIAKKGRASYLGEASAGHQDPGATSIYFILRTLLDVVKTRLENEGINS
jgi:phosphoenolpyruvate---glycerone phosphotransferase subunit DhaL